MKIFWLFFTTLFLLAGQPQTASAQLLSGKITSEKSNQGIPNAKVQALMKAGKGAMTKTNPAGDYTLSIPEGTTRLLIACEGFQTQMLKLEDVKTGDLQLAPKVSINKAPDASTSGAMVQIAQKGQAVSVSGGGLGASFLRFVFDHEAYTFYVKNLSNPDRPVYSGDFEKMNDDSELFNSDLYYHAAEDGTHHYSVELKDKFVVTNFPFSGDSEERTGLFSGVNTKVDNRRNFNQFDGVYMGFLLNMPTGKFDSEDGMIWGIALFTHLEPEDSPYGEQTGMILMNLYDTNTLRPEDVNWDDELEMLIEAVGGDYEYENEEAINVIMGFYTVDPEADEAFDVQLVSLEDIRDAESEEDFQESSTFFAAAGFADDNSAVMTVDVPEQGILQFVKIADLEGNDSDQDGPAGDYLYVQSDVDFGGGAGIFEINDDYEMNVHLFPDQYESEKDVETQVETQKGLRLMQGGIQNLYYTDGYEDEDLGDFAERLYLIISNDFMIHFTIDKESGGLLNYGIGAIDE